MFRLIKIVVRNFVEWSGINRSAPQTSFWLTRLQPFDQLMMS